MSLMRDLVWQRLDAQYRSSVAHQFARYALGLDYTLLPKEVVHEAKRCLLDALGCAIGALDAPGRAACESVAQELGGPEEATVFGSGLRTNVLGATLVNSFLVRFLDYNDIGGGGHNSDAIPAILATAERHKASGRDLLTSLVISYELGVRLRESVVGRSLVDRGWATDIRGGLNMPPALGRLMGLSEAEIAHAIGICTSHALPLGILDADQEENSMTKNLRFGFVAHSAVLSCMLAKRGFTGPIRVIEGDAGFRQVVLDGDMDLERLMDFSGWRILKTVHKCLPVNGNSLGHVLATLSIVTEHDLKPEDIKAVRIKACLHETHHTTTPAKKYARNAESADHSAFFVNAIIIKERALTPASYTSEKFIDPVILDLIEKITVEYDPSMGIFGFQGSSEIITMDGRRFFARVDVPHGTGDDPLTDRELEEKFSAMASERMGGRQIQNIFGLIWGLENVSDVRKLADLMKVKQR
jgi:2-methylcitrate dehydratase